MRGADAERPLEPISVPHLFQHIGRDLIQGLLFQPINDSGLDEIKLVVCELLLPILTLKEVSLVESNRQGDFFELVELVIESGVAGRHTFNLT